MHSERSVGAFTRLLGVAAAIALFTAILALFSPSLQVGAQAARTTAIVWVISAVSITAWFAPTQGERRLVWFISLASVYGLLFWLRMPSLNPGTLFIVMLVLLTTGALVGGYIGSLLEYPGMLMVVAYVAAIADCFSVFHPSGLTARVMANKSVLALLTVPFPVLGTAQISSLVGIGDVAFAALFVVGARATALDARRTLVAVAASFIAVAIAAETMHASLPALPFMSAAVVLAHPEARKLPPEHTRRIAANLALVTIVLGGLLLSAALRYG